MAELNARDTKLVDYLNEAYTKEKQLEQALEAHIGMTTLAPYRKRLQQHLSETKRHAREVERRIKKIGGETNGGIVQEALGVGQDVAAKTVALAQGQYHAVRGTSEQETQLKNARTEFKEEAEEIGTYTMIQNLAEKVGDRDTASLAKAILREEKRMAGFLEKLIPRLTKAVAQAEIPARERNGGSRRRTTTRRATSGSRSGTSRSSGTRSRSGAAKKSASGSTRSASSRARSSARSASGSSRRTTAKKSGSSASRSSGARKTTGRSSSGRKTARRTTSRSSSR